jgi:hypothetical protein
MASLSDEEAAKPGGSILVNDQFVDFASEDPAAPEVGDDKDLDVDEDAFDAFSKERTAHRGEQSAALRVPSTDKGRSPSPMQSDIADLASSLKISSHVPFAAPATAGFNTASSDPFAMFEESSAATPRSASSSSVDPFQRAQLGVTRTLTGPAGDEDPFGEFSAMESGPGVAEDFGAGDDWGEFGVADAGPEALEGIACGPTIGPMRWGCDTVPHASSQPCLAQAWLTAGLRASPTQRLTFILQQETYPRCRPSRSGRTATRPRCSANQVLRLAKWKPSWLLLIVDHMSCG